MARDTCRSTVSERCGLVRRVPGYDPTADADLIERAFAIAAEAHGAQTRDNGEPYITHPLAVAGILAGYRLDVASICTGLLHDTVEDTGLKLPQLEARFGPAVAGLVDGVTKLTRLELQSDRTKQAENFRKLVLAMSRDIRVLIVKLADRLHNMRTLHYVERPERRQRIAAETMDIYAPLAGRIGMDKVKTELQNLAFAELEPEHNATIQARLNYLRGQGADVIEEVRRELVGCAEAGVPTCEVTGREKSPFSIWEKMQRRNVAFEQLSDIMAFRVVVPTRESCYVALGAVHAAYPVIAGRFKDYISTPKANGYQSLHTGVTLRSPRNQKIEVQIRTPDMHDIAENGVAAHWSYKGRRGEGRGAPAQRPPLGAGPAGDPGEFGGPDEFLENTKLELYQDQVFCFTPQGPADPAAARRHPGRLRLCRAQPDRRHLRRRQGERAAAAAAPRAAERRPGRDHDRARRHAVAGLGTLRRHRQGAGAHPPLRRRAAARDASRRRPRSPGQGVPPGRRRRVREGAGRRAQDAEVREPGRPLRRGRQRQPRAQGRGARGSIRSCGRPRGPRMIPGLAPRRRPARRMAARPGSA